MPIRPLYRRLMLLRFWHRIASIVVVTSLLSASVVVAQQASAGGTLISYDGEVIVTHANGTVEQAKVGTPVNSGDRVAVPRAGGALIGYGDGSKVGLQPGTTLDFKQSEGTGTNPAAVTADISRGVATAETANNREAIIKITSEASGAVALLKKGDMAVRLDESTGNVSVACDEPNDQVYFPYEDWKVPCEQRTVRTFTSDGDVVDTHATGSLLSAVVDNSGDRRGDGIQPGGQTEQRQQEGGDKDKDDDDDNQNNGPATVSHTTGPLSVSASCLNTSPDGANCTASIVNATDAQVGGTLQIISQTRNASTTAVGTETINCGTISSSFGASCTFNFAHQIFQNGQLDFVYPLASGGNRTLSFSWICFAPRSPGQPC